MPLTAGQAIHEETSMWDWIASNHQVLGVAANIAMLFVWIAYLQVFVSSYRRQKRPSILVNWGAGSGLEARCLISNMSAEAIYIESLIATVETSQGRWSCPVTELQEGRSDTKLATRQGPLQAGEFVDIGSFQSLVEPVLRRNGELPGGAAPDGLEDLVAFEMKVIAVHGSDDLLAGAVRRFDLIRRRDQLLLRGHEVGTRQIRSRRKREKLRDDVEADL
ncbi:hypothetical protein ACFOYU_01070 [Microvirga sp. GCM10011540]|uniref:hypothetical protein n=1 Tax=Microvirga sp. GCM10011540 TaxID=3317338 RepID=UPI003612E152